MKQIQKELTRIQCKIHYTSGFYTGLILGAVATIVIYMAVELLLPIFNF